MECDCVHVCVRGGCSWLVQNISLASARRRVLSISPSKSTRLSLVGRVSDSHPSSSLELSSPLCDSRASSCWMSKWSASCHNLISSCWTHHLHCVQGESSSFHQRRIQRISVITMSCLNSIWDYSFAYSRVWIHYLRFQRDFKGLWILLPTTFLMY